MQIPKQVRDDERESVRVTQESRFRMTLEMSMEVKIEKKEKGKVKLIITLTPKEMAVHFKTAFDKVAPTIKLPGFREGKAPRKLIESSAGVARILSDGLDIAVSDSYFKATREEKFIPIVQPNIVINKYPHYGHTEKEVGEIFEYEAEFEILPPVTLKDYSKIKIDKKTAEKAKKEDVDKVLSHILKQNAEMKDLDRPAKNGDRIEINFEGFVKHVRIDQMCSKNHPLILGEKTLIPGFEEELVGLKTGDKKDFKIKFPKDYHGKEYAGKEAQFKVEVLSLKEVILPKEDDELAKKFGHDTMKELKDAIEKNLNMELEENAKRELENNIIGAMLPLLSVEIPDSLISREIERMISDFSSQITGRGLNFDKYLEGIKKTREDLLKEMKPQAERNIKVGLMLGKIVEEQKLDQNDPEAGKKAMEFLVSKLTK